VDSNSGSVIEIQPDQLEYFVVTNLKGGEVPISSLRYNTDESALLTYQGKDTVMIKLIPA
jgi:hypothetical protein